MSEAFDLDRAVSVYDDKTYRLNNLYMIKDENGEAVPFRMNEAQTRLHENRHNRDLILKARQLGFTTYIQIDMLDDCLWIDNFSAGVVAHNRDDAEAFFSDKIKFAYDNLPGWLKDRRQASTDRTNELKFSNGSRIRVGTSHRSGTLQYLHVSELGKLAADRPDLAKEVITGSFPTVHGRNRIVVESTARGQGGEFHKLSVKAENAMKEGRELTPIDFKFHFFPWWQHPNYQTEPIRLRSQDEAYFRKLGVQGIRLTDRQKAWHVKTAELMDDDMGEEYPSTPDEAFEATVKGAYFATAMTKVRTEERICTVPIEPVPVNTFWDLGGGDYTAIWFHQQIGKEHRFLKYLTGDGEDAAYWATQCEEWRLEHQVGWGKHYLPHDGASKLGAARKSWKSVLEDNGLRDIVVVARAPSTDDVVEGINECRTKLSSCWFDEAGCGGKSKEKEPPTGIECLDNYRKEWDKNRSVYKRTPRHDEYSHGADAFRTFAVGYKPMVQSAEKPQGRARF